MTAVCFNEDASQVMSAGIDNMVKVWDLRKNAVVTEISGHTDTVTGMMLSPDGSNVLTNSMDGTVRIFDIQPFCTGERCLKVCDAIILFSKVNTNVKQSFETRC